MSVCLLVCLCVCLSVSLSVCLTVYLFVCLTMGSVRVRTAYIMCDSRCSHVRVTYVLCVCECTYIRAYAFADVFAHVCTHCWMYIMVVRLVGLHPGRLGGMFKGCLAASKWPQSRIAQKWDDVLKFLPGTAIHPRTCVQ